MCQYGNTKNIFVNIPAHLSYTGKSRWDIKPVDSCIADKVRNLNESGQLTASSCCGHGKFNPEIILQNGAKIVLKNGEWEIN